MKLSKSRVKSVQKYLVDGGIAKSRIKIDWKGESDPLPFKEDTKKGLVQNRRVEVEEINE